MKYLIETRVNYADTSRDPDKIVVKELATVASKDEATAFIHEYIKEKFFHSPYTEEHPYVIRESNGELSCQEFCSWGRLLRAVPIGE